MVSEVADDPFGVRKQASYASWGQRVIGSLVDSLVVGAPILVGYIVQLATADVREVRQVDPFTGEIQETYAGEPTTVGIVVFTIMVVVGLGVAV